MSYRKILQYIIIAAASLGMSCNTSPTIPLPPPEVTLITTGVPDADGIVHVIGAPEAASMGDIVLVFNDDTGDGSMRDAEDDGSFEVPIRAEISHILVIQLKRGNTLSPEVEKVVGE